MKNYLLDFARTMWKPFVIAVAAVIGVMYSVKHHYYVAMSVFGMILSVVMCLWTPWLEENFKLRHSNTKVEAVAFSLFEFMLYSYQAFGVGVGLFILLRLPMLLLHSASGLCYYHYPNRRMKMFWYVNHSLWNIASAIVPTWLYTGTSFSSIRPTTLTVCLMTFWGTSLLFKLFRSKKVVC